VAKGPEQRVQSKECKAKSSDINVEERSNALHTRPSKDKDKINFSEVNMEKFLKMVFSPIVFGVLFLAPLIAQSMTAAGLQIFTLPNLIVGLFIGGGLGLMAYYRGSWIWIK
jgi:hypothetical protein